MKIAFLGTGLMGFPMAKRLADAGFELNVYNRTKSKTENLVDLNANIFDNPLSAVKKSDIIDFPTILLLPYLNQNPSVLLQNNSHTC